jgi:dTDP-N-acetylfucosamine:lipid II N-acetylfucosaminyltransferase
MILHLVDDEKIINRTIDLFEMVNKGNNKFLIDIPDSQHQLRYVKEKEGTYTAVYGSAKYWEIVGDINQYEAVIIHLLTKNKCQFISKYKNTDTSFVWILWGADLYNFLTTKGYKLYLWKPSFLKFKLRWTFKDTINNFIRGLGDRIRGRETLSSLYENAYLRIDHCGIFNKGDFKLLKDYVKTEAKWHWFNYYPIDNILGKDLLSKKINGDNIIVGNSGSNSGNHVPAFELLKKLNPKGRKIIVPLSYGNPLYCELVIEKGTEILGNSFVPIKDFMPLQEYNNLLCSANIVIMPQLRQEAVGNILISLFLGAKVYLYEENNLYEYFTTIGVKVFSIKKDLTSSNIKAFDPLSVDDQLNNRNIILSEFNEERIIYQTQRMLEEVVKWKD